LDLRALEIFLAISETGGVTAAARRLGLTQAAASQQLGKLERELKVELLDRTVRPPRLTPAGFHRRDRCRKLFADIEDTRRLLERFRHAAIPELRIGVIESLAAALLPRLVNRLSSLTGALSVTSGTTQPLLPSLLRGEIDLIVTTEEAEGIDDLEVIPIIAEPLVLILPPGSVPPESLGELAELASRLPFLHYGRQRRLSRLTDRYLERLGVDLPRKVEFDSSFPMVDMVRLGMGWGVTTPLCLYSVRAGPADLVVAPLPGVSASRQVDLIARRGQLYEVPQKVAAACKEIIRLEVMPGLRALAPFASDRLQLDGPDRPTEARPTGLLAGEPGPAIDPRSPRRRGARV